MGHLMMRNADEDEPEEETVLSDDEEDDVSDSGSESESDSSGEEADKGEANTVAQVQSQGQCRLVDSYELHATLGTGPDRLKKQMRNLRIILRDCMADYDMILHGTVPDDPEEAAEEERERVAPAAGLGVLVNGPISQPTPPPTPPADPELQLQQQERNIRALLAGPGAEEFESDVDMTLPLEEQIKRLMTETRMLRIDNYMLKEVISYQLRLVNLQAGHAEQREERNKELENEVKELKIKANGLQDEIMSMKSNQNLIGRHEQATQTTSLVYPITITSRPKLKPSGNSAGGSSSGSGGGGRPQSGPGGRVSGGSGAGPSGSGNGFKKLPKPKLPEPNNITHRGPPKYQYGQGQRIPFGSSASPVKKSTSPRKVSDHENDGDDDDDDDEPEMPATRSHASNHHANTYSRKSRPQPKMLSSHRRSSASSTDSSASESRSSPRQVAESTTPAVVSSGRVTPTRSKGLSSPSRSPPLRHSSPTDLGNCSPVRVSSPVGHSRASPVRVQSPPPVRDRERAHSPAKTQSSPHRLNSPPVRQPSPIRQPSPPRGRLSSLRRAGKDKLYFTPTRSPSKSRMQKNKQQTPKPSELTSSTSTPIPASSSSKKSAVAPPPAATTSRAKSKSPTRPNSIQISRETTDSPNLFSGDNSSSSSPSNSLSKATDDEYDNLFSQFKKCRPTPIIVTSAAEAKLNSGDVSNRKAVVIKNSALLSALRKDDYVKQSKTAMVRLDRASTTTATRVPAPQMRPLDYDWMIPSRPIPFINDGQKAGTSKGTANLVRTALRRKRTSPMSKEELTKKIRMMSLSKIGKKSANEKELRSYIAKKYEVKKQEAKKVVEEEEASEELYDIDEYIEPSRPTPVPMSSQPKATPSTSTFTPISRPPTLNPDTGKAKPAALSSTAPPASKSSSTPIKTKTKKTKPSSLRLSTPGRTEVEDSTERSPSTSPSPRRRREKSYCWPLRTYTNRHEDTLMTDDPFYAMASTGRPIGSIVDDDDEVQFIAEYDDDGVEMNARALALVNEEEPPKKAGTEVLVPSWRVMKFAPVKCRQLNEDLSDSVYERRHAKWEIDERRRKRWDAQIQREEEYTKYLREREAQKAQRALKRYNRATGTSGVMEHDDTLTLLPDSKQARFILVADNLPVASFGYAVPDLETNDFKRPWKDRNEEDGPDEEVDLILRITTRATRRANRRMLASHAPPPRKPSTSSRGQSPGPSSGAATEGGTKPQGSGTESKDVKPRIKQPKDDDMYVD